MPESTVPTAIPTKPELNFSDGQFRSACASFPTGVTVLTRRLRSGEACGMTASSFTSVSLHPPLILVCIDRRAKFLEEIERHVRFVVNVLSDSQHLIAKRFSDPDRSHRFNASDWSSAWMDLPVLHDTSATFYCSVEQIVDAGDHLVLISNVNGLHRTERRPLVWCERSYHSLPPIG